MIQLINYSGTYSVTSDIVVSKIAEPKALDDFQINIIDLNNEAIWRNSADNHESIDCIQDFMHLGEMIKNKNNSNVIVIMPQNMFFKYNYGVHSRHISSVRSRSANSKSYKNHIEVKNLLESIKKILCVLVKSHQFSLLYENTETKLNSEVINASFYFATSHGILTTSQKSNKPTTIKLENGTIATTLGLNSQEKIIEFLEAIALVKKDNEEPEWMHRINFFDDDQKKKLITEDLKKIEELNSEIENAKNKLKVNNKYKSVLYENGDKLVETVFDMLEDMLKCELSSFVDKNKEDFLVKLKEITFIGEIKGVNTNVRSEYISQLEVHYQSYLDRLEESNNKEEVKAILIINHQRNIDLSIRKPVNENQIKLAIRNNSLIIETHTLLKLFESYKLQQISNEEIIDIFKNEKGLLKL